VVAVPSRGRTPSSFCLLPDLPPCTPCPHPTYQQVDTIATMSGERASALVLQIRSAFAYFMRTMGVCVEVNPRPKTHTSFCFSPSPPPPPMSCAHAFALPCCPAHTACLCAYAHACFVSHTCHPFSDTYLPPDLLPTSVLQPPPFSSNS
jgi:hypothetical protein